MVDQSCDRRGWKIQSEYSDELTQPSYALVQLRGRGYEVGHGTREEGAERALTLHGFVEMQDAWNFEAIGRISHSDVRKGEELARKRFSVGPARCQHVSPEISYTRDHVIMAVDRDRDDLLARDGDRNVFQLNQGSLEVAPF